MFKLYKRIDGVLHYREGWQNQNDAIEHWGVCGERGKAQTHSFASHAEALHKWLSLEKEARTLGYRDISEGKHAWLVVEFEIAGLPEGVDPLPFRHKLEDHLNELTGWLGVGHCDGGSIGSGTLEAACRVVDYEVSLEAIARELVGTWFSGYSRIYQEAT